MTYLIYEILFKLVDGIIKIMSSKTTSRRENMWDKQGVGMFGNIMLS